MAACTVVRVTARTSAMSSTGRKGVEVAWRPGDNGGVVGRRGACPASAPGAVPWPALSVVWAVRIGVTALIGFPLVGLPVSGMADGIGLGLLVARQVWPGYLWAGEGG